MPGEVLRQCSAAKPADIYVPSMTTVNSPNNGHFGARPTVRYSGCVLYWGVIVGAGYGMEVPCQYRLYGPREYISRLREYIQSLVDRELIIIAIIIIFTRCID